MKSNISEEVWNCVMKWETNKMNFCKKKKKNLQNSWKFLRYLSSFANIMQGSSFICLISTSVLSSMIAPQFKFLLLILLTGVDLFLVKINIWI